MSVTLRSPVTVKGRKRKSERKTSGSCWETESVCAGDRLIVEHAGRVAWWLVSFLVIVALVLIGIIGQHAFNTEHTGPWSTLNSSSWIQPTPRALASLVGITLVIDMYTSYIMALKKGHLDNYIGQFLLSAVIRICLWIFFLYGLSYGGFIGSMLSLIVLAIVVAWGFMTSHSCAPLHAWISALELLFIGFLIVWLATAGVKVMPVP